MKPPCGKVCPERHAGCQGKCKKYRDFRAEIEAKRPTLYQDNDIDDYIRNVKIKISRHKMSSLHRGCKRDK